MKTDQEPLLAACPRCGIDRDMHAVGGCPTCNKERERQMGKAWGRLVLKLSEKADHSDNGADIRFVSPDTLYKDSSLTDRYVLIAFNEGGYNTTCQDLEQMLREVAACPELTGWLAERGITLKAEK